MGTASRYHFLPAYDLAPPLAYIENLLDNRLCKGHGQQKAIPLSFKYADLITDIMLNCMGLAQSIRLLPTDTP